MKSSFIERGRIMTQKQIEKRALIITTLVNLIIAAAGTGMWLITGLQMLFLDGFFSLILVISSVTAVLISKLSGKTTKRYPQGLYFLEPLYAIFKSVLIIAVMVHALISSAQVAFDYFFNGNGQIMNTAPIPAYSVAMTVLCIGLSVFNRKQYKKTNNTSTMLHAEYQANLIDGLQSASIGVAILILQSIPLDSILGFLHYTGDFFILIVLFVTSIKNPVVLLVESFHELTGGITQDKDICEAVKLSTGLPTSAFTVQKTGMKIKVNIPKSVIMQTDLAVKEDMLQTLQQYYEYAEIKYIA